MSNILQVGIVCNNLGYNQLSYMLVPQLNVLAKEWASREVVAFFTDPAPPMIKTEFAIYNSYELYSYPGICVATDIDTAERVLRTPNAQRKYLYVWNFEWLVNMPVQYERYANIYQDSRVSLITRTESHRETMLNNFGRDSIVIENINVPQIIKLIESEVYPGDRQKAA